ncbi:hypothetical protein PQO01_13985 [Lentisphaera marina]|uniref:DUF5077 domain-containing protein n=1 Tax=Lentisphaera marina TaxID=1111041 RepID=UPI0023651BAB|nr:hypothetical protein [Lentisphaera marina]MDD7986057.1 hypothetical protein [Lentisphaera marina]
MKLFLALAISHFMLFGSNQGLHLFDGKKLSSLQADKFTQSGSSLKGLGNLLIESNEAAVQIDIMIQAVKADTHLKVDGELVKNLNLVKSESQHLSFTYRRLKDEQRSIRLSGQKSQYFGEGAKFNPSYFEGSLVQDQEDTKFITLNFDHPVIIHRMRIIPLNKFSIKEFFLMSPETEQKFYTHTDELYKNQCFECHGEKMTIHVKGTFRPVKRSLASHAQLYKYIKQHRDLKDPTIHSLAWYINKKIFKTHHKSLYRTYSTAQWKKLPESLYSVEEFLEKKEAASQLHYTLNAEQGTLVNQGEARFINGALEFWNDPQTWIKWQIELKHPGFVDVSIEQAFPDEQLAEYSINIGAEELQAKVVQTESWGSFKKIELGKIYINEPGTYTITLVPKNKPGVAVMNLRNLKISGLPVFKLTTDTHKTVFHYTANSEKNYASKIVSAPEKAHDLTNSIKKEVHPPSSLQNSDISSITPIDKPQEAPNNKQSTEIHDVEKVTKKSEFIYI